MSAAFYTCMGILSGPHYSELKQANGVMPGNQTKETTKLLWEVARRPDAALSRSKR